MSSDTNPGGIHGDRGDDWQLDVEGSELSWDLPSSKELPVEEERIPRSLTGHELDPFDQFEVDAAVPRESASMARNMRSQVHVKSDDEDNER